VAEASSVINMHAWSGFASVPRLRLCSRCVKLAAQEMPDWLGNFSRNRRRLCKNNSIFFGKKALTEIKKTLNKNCQ